MGKTTISKRGRNKKKIRVFNFIDDDKEFESFSEACRVLNLKTWKVSRALDSGDMVNGYFFDYAF